MALIEGFTHQQFAEAAEQLHAAGGVFLLARPRSFLDAAGTVLRMDGATETECAVCGHRCWKMPREPEPLPIGVFPVCTDCMVRQRCPLPATSGGIRVFVVNDYDYVAAPSETAAREFYLREMGLDPEEAFGGWEGVLCDDDLRRLVFTDVDQNVTRSFAEELQRKIDAGQQFPCVFASTEI